MKHCPEAITVTDNRDVANYVLRITPGASTLYKQDGDVAYISPTRWKISNLAKDCVISLALNVESWEARADFARPSPWVPRVTSSS
jgi:hypothetical protein